MATFIGELEFNEKHYHVDGNATFLWMDYTEQDKRTWFFMSPYPEEKVYNLGNNIGIKGRVSLYDFLKLYVEKDEDLGRTSAGSRVTKSLANCKVRLKGFTEWIGRDEVKKSLTS